MDPQTLAFTPRDDFWRMQADMVRVQQTQVEHSERLLKLERRHDDDSRMRSVWGASSPFPSMIGGTPQQGPVQQPLPDSFEDFEDQSNNLLGSLNLDPGDVRRRGGATSRSNSVRFDETANQGHWSHHSKSSAEFLTRTPSGLGALAMTERSSSHKSDGKQSSAAQSVHSAQSGRANSFASDVNLASAVASMADNPQIAPGLSAMGSVPCIIRCWLDTSFRHDTLLYAAICTGSHTSWLDISLIQQRNLHEFVQQQEDGTRKINLVVYLPEAVPYQPSSRPGSPMHQLPALTTDFTIFDTMQVNGDPRAIRIFIGSDLLQLRRADILMSSNKLLISDDDRGRVMVPLVRPEDESGFKSLVVASLPNYTLRDDDDDLDEEEDEVNTAVETSDKAAVAAAAAAAAVEVDEGSHPHRETAHQTNAADASSDHFVGTKNMYRARNSEAVKRKQRSQQFGVTGPGVERLLGDLDDQNGESYIPNSASSADEQHSVIPNPPNHHMPVSNIWSNWRSNPDKTNQSEWTQPAKPTSTNYHRREQGIKVLKPTRSVTKSLRNLQAGSKPTSETPPEGSDKTKGQRTVLSDMPDVSRRRSLANEDQAAGEEKRSHSTITRARSANPVGGASAFSWLNSGGSK